MSSPAPILRLVGIVHADPAHVVVPERPAEPEQRDHNGAITRRAREYRPSYEKYDVMVLTDNGGFASLVLRSEALEAAGGWMPAKGDRIDIPVRAFTLLRGAPGSWYNVVNYSLAGDALATELRESSSGSRVAVAS